MEESELNEDYNTKAVVKTEPTEGIEDVKVDFKIKLDNEELACVDPLKIEESTYMDDVKSETTGTSFTNPMAVVKTELTDAAEDVDMNFKIKLEIAELDCEGPLKIDNVKSEATNTPFTNPNIKSEKLHLLHELKTETIDDVRKSPDNMATEIKDSSMNNGAKGTKKLFKCPVCKFQTKFRNSLSVHMQIHLGDKPFQCSLCPCKYKHEGSLRVHLLRHENYKCSLCKNTRKGSIKEHTAEEPYRCFTCKYGPNRRVKAHALLHAGKHVSHSE